MSIGSPGKAAAGLVVKSSASCLSPMLAVGRCDWSDVMWSADSAYAEIAGKDARAAKKAAASKVFE
ncbi:MAG: hypothetical protein ABI348_04345 [Nitrososphaera sp.]